MQDHHTRLRALDEGMVPVRRKVPAHERVHTELRRMILYGELRPGQPVTLH